MRLHLRVWPLFYAQRNWLLVYSNSSVRVEDMGANLCSNLEQEFVGSVLSVWMFYVLVWGMYTYTKKTTKKKKEDIWGTPTHTTLPTFTTWVKMAPDRTQSAKRTREGGEGFCVGIVVTMWNRMHHIQCERDCAAHLNQQQETTVAHRLTIVEIEEAEGMSAQEILEDEMFGTRIGVPAMCSEWCTVELDGTCPHGFKSLALHMGVV